MVVGAPSAPSLEPSNLSSCTFDLTLAHLRTRGVRMRFVCLPIMAVLERRGAATVDAIADDGIVRTLEFRTDNRTTRRWA